MRQTSCKESDKIDSINNYLLFLIETDQFYRVTQLMLELNKTPNGYFDLLARLKLRQKIL